MNTNQPMPRKPAVAGGSLSRRAFLSCMPGLAALLACPAAHAQYNSGPGWSATWGTAPAGPPPSGAMQFSDQTLRLVARASIGGERVRIRLSNEMGSTPLRIGAATIALRRSGANVHAESVRTLSFGGRPGAVIPPGAPLVSDPVTLAVPPQSDLAVSIYLPGTTSATTMHNAALQESYASPVGNHVAASDMQPQQRFFSWPFLTEIDVESPAGCVVAYGDSITDGQGSPIGANKRWPDFLARRLLAADLPLGVANRGISANSLLTDYPALSTGRDALERFDRDVAATAGARAVIILIGINDIVYSPRDNPVPAEDLIAGYQQLAERARLRGLKVIGGTLTPFQGHPYYSEKRDAVRTAVNAWMRAAAPFDALADFDLALRYPENEAQLLGEYDSGDKLHPSVKGYEAMAQSIPLSALW